MKLSLVCPCYNEGANVVAFYNTCAEVLGREIEKIEFVFVNDGSKDDTIEKLHLLFRQAKHRIKIINFSRNFGKEAAMYAGLQHTEGEYICLIDTDLQQRPETVLEMVRLLDKHPNYDCVAAFQEKRKESKLIIGCKDMFYKFINSICDIDFKSGASDFRTFRQPVRQAILSLSETHRFTKGIFSWIGFNTYYIPYVAAERNAGSTSWSFVKLIKYAMSGISAFTTFPLQFATILGSCFSAFSLLYLIVIIIEKLFFDIAIPGYATIVALVSLIGGIQLLCLGMLGSYLAKVYIQGKQRPIYIAKEIKDSKDNKDKYYS